MICVMVFKERELDIIKTCLPPSWRMMESLESYSCTLGMAKEQRAMRNTPREAGSIDG